MGVKNTQEIGIYGTGLAAKTVFDALTKMGIEVSFFLDKEIENIGKIFCNKTITDINGVNKESTILIAANPAYGIHERLNNAGINQWKYVDPEFLCLLSEGYDRKKVTQILRENEKKIQQVYNMLEDEKSKKVLGQILRHRVEHDLSLISDIYDENQYFGNDVVGKIGGNFVDCGAFDGDTLKRFVAQAPKESVWHYYAFEAEKQNYISIEKYCKENQIKNVSLYNLAVYDQRIKLAFLSDENDEKVSGKIYENENMASFVQGDSIDNVLHDRQIDMIIMDIEGAEIKALQGAKKCISKQSPKLAVSAYHFIEHLWEIPLLIKEINPDYRFFFRHHRWNMHDTVCYAIPDKRCGEM